MSGRAELDAFIAGVERVGSLNRDVAAAAEKPVADVARKSIAAGQSPTGTKWPEKKDGGQALEGASEALESGVDGSKIVLKIAAPYVFHDHGAGGSSTTKEAVRHRARTAARQASTGTKSKFHSPERQMLPHAGEGVPEPMKEAIREVAKDVFGKAMG